MVYRRPPDDVTVYEQELVVDRADLKVTFMSDAPFQQELRVGDDASPIAEPGSPLVWFVFPGAWYDIGAFHLRDGSFTGYYTNFIRPAALEGRRWEMEDLCLDLWLGADGALEVLDREELDIAVSRGWIDASTARHVEGEVARIRRAAEEGRWPPAAVRKLDLAGVLRLRA